MSVVNHKHFNLVLQEGQQLGALKSNIKKTLSFKYCNVTFSQFSGKYQSNGWIGRKLKVIPYLAFSVPSSIFFRVMYIFVSGIPRAMIGNTKPIKHYVFVLIREFEEIFGVILSLFYDKLGLYFIEDANFHRYNYQQHFFFKRTREEKTTVLKNIDNQNYDSALSGMKSFAGTKKSKDRILTKISEGYMSKGSVLKCLNTIELISPENEKLEELLELCAASLFKIVDAEKTLFTKKTKLREFVSQFDYIYKNTKLKDYFYAKLAEKYFQLEEYADSLEVIKKVEKDIPKKENFLVDLCKKYFEIEKVCLAEEVGNMIKNSELKKKAFDRPVEKHFDGFEHENVLTLENRLNALVLDQPEATSAVVNAVMNYAIKMKDPAKPVGVFLFLGPTGVGKTELAKALSQEIYKDKNRLIRFDMSSFSEEHSSSRLIGSPPGYTGYAQGGQLTNPLIEDPYRVVLLDEVEKSHEKVMKVFLPIIDEGQITDSSGKKVECKDTIFIGTSNLCAKEIAEMIDLGYSEEQILKAIEPILMKALSPEVYNRLEPVIFRPLTENTTEKLVNMMLDEVAKRLKSGKDITLNIDETVKSYLSKQGFHPTLGARPLKRLIDNKVVAKIAHSIMSEKIPDGSSLKISYCSNTDKMEIALL